LACFNAGSGSGDTEIKTSFRCIDYISADLIKSNGSSGCVGGMDIFGIRYCRIAGQVRDIGCGNIIGCIIQQCYIGSRNGDR